MKETVSAEWNEPKEKFAPGPWNVIGGEIMSPSDQDFPVATVHTYEDEERSDANAALIAAAPEIYAVLLGVLKVLEAIDYEIMIEGRDLQDIISNILKKARGEE